MSEKREKLLDLLTEAQKLRTATNQMHQECFELEEQADVLRKDIMIKEGLLRLFGWRYCSAFGVWLNAEADLTDEQEPGVAEFMELAPLDHYHSSFVLDEDRNIRLQLDDGELALVFNDESTMATFIDEQKLSVNFEDLHLHYDEAKRRFNGLREIASRLGISVDVAVDQNCDAEEE